MKQYFVMAALLMLVAGICAMPALAQDTGVIKGVCKDVDGKPIVGGVVEWMNVDTGRKYDVKTNNKGEYFSLGITPGHYKVTLFGPDNKEVFHFNGFTVVPGDNPLDFDMKKEQEQAANNAKETSTVKTLNEKLAAAKAAADTGDFDTAIAQITQATQTDPTRDLLWAKLGDYEIASAAKQTDSAEKTKRYEAAVTGYEKAVDLKQKALDTAPSPKPPDATKTLA